MSASNKSDQSDATNSANITYVLEHRGVVDGHIRKHKATWPRIVPPGEINAPIQVYVRVRPLLQIDHDAKSFSLATVQASRLIHVTHPTVRWAGGRIATKTYEADAIFDEDVDSSEVYNGMNLSTELDRLLSSDGSEISIVAYGQTGTGKTYTTTYIEERIAGELFEHVRPDHNVRVTISILELRGSNAYDLLSTPALQPIKISVAGVAASYQGLTLHEVSDKNELLRFIQLGRDLRFTRSTSKNDVSSRSHSIVNIKIVQTSPRGTTIQSTINVVDLAGSERSSVISKHDPERVKESVDTNKSLAAFKDCIRARLTDGQTRIPWRADKLTMALKGAFDTKNASDGTPRNKVFIIACVSPSVIDVEDTLNTLRYVTPFQLSASAAAEATITQNDLGDFNDPKFWSPEESRSHITRRMQKWAPVIERLLPTPESTMSSLLNLSIDDLNAMIDTPNRKELSPAQEKRYLVNGKPVAPAGKFLTPEPAKVELAKSFTKEYYEQLQSWVRESDAIEQMIIDAQNNAEGATGGVVAKATAGTTTKARNAAALKALNGTDFTANETGVVQRVRLDQNGTNWEAIEKMEKKMTAASAKSKTTGSGSTKK
ncbi:P-loop containing nucleoside triphosphate hydrolase protein [Clavulina sp. PMI_390]|nr:P-loop containing nucleoside triphosphate hydrolase protein [Clavulina sp. PMI_390]